jgi:hypothetical protein
MSKVPTSVRFLLCDDARAEASGKITIVGLYPDDKIVVQLGQQTPTGLAAALSQLSFVCILNDGDGTFPASAMITGPGISLPKMSLGSPTFKRGEHTTIILQGGQFLVPQFGKFACTLTIGVVDHRFPFEIISRPAPVAALPAALVVKKKPRRKP